MKSIKLTSFKSLSFLAIAAITLTLLAAPAHKAYAVSTSDIISATADTDCMDWEIVGVCVWLQCAGPYCTVETSMKVKHYIPEVVVSSYASTGENPWEDVASMSSENSSAKGTGFMVTPSKKRDNLPRFKNADVIGHPGGYVLNNMDMDYICESATTGFRPYYLSTLDSIAWRWGLTESLYLASSIPGMREIRSGSHGWGSVFPRQGFLVQPDDGKAGAVMAQRAADFVVRSKQPHIYTSIHADEDESEGWWPPGFYEDPLKEGDEATHKWQPLHPKQESCTVFPTSAVPEQDEKGGYAYALWRPYRCCEPEGIFLFSVGE